METEFSSLTPFEKRVYEILSYVSKHPILTEEHLVFDAKKVANELLALADNERKDTHTEALSVNG